MTDPEWERPARLDWDDDEVDLDVVKDHQRRRLVRLSTLGGLAVVVGLVLTVWLLVAYDRASEQDDRINRLEELGDERSNDLDRVADAVDQLREQIEGLGAVPVVPSAEELVGETGASDPDDPDPDDPEAQEPEAQEPEQQDAEIDDPDPDSPDPDDAAAAVSFSRLVAAVAAFCEANDGCRGPAGADGDDGADGTAACPAGFHFTQIRIPSQPDAMFLICIQD